MARRPVASTSRLPAFVKVVKLIKNTPASKTARESFADGVAVQMSYAEISKKGQIPKIMSKGGEVNARLWYKPSGSGLVTSLKYGQQTVALPGQTEHGYEVANYDELIAFYEWVITETETGALDAIIDPIKAEMSARMRVAAANRASAKSAA